MKYEEKLKKELIKYPKPENELAVASYCIEVIDKNNKLTNYEKNSFSNHLSRIMIESELEGYQQANEEINKLREQIKKLTNQLANSVSLECLKKEILKSTNKCQISNKEKESPNKIFSKEVKKIK